MEEQEHFLKFRMMMKRALPIFDFTEKQNQKILLCQRAASSRASSTATPPPPTLYRLQSGMRHTLVAENSVVAHRQAVRVHGVSRFFRKSSDEYMRRFWSEPILRLP